MNGFAFICPTGRTYRMRSLVCLTIRTNIARTCNHLVTSSSHISLRFCSSSLRNWHDTSSLLTFESTCIQPRSQGFSRLIVIACLETLYGTKKHPDSPDYPFPTQAPRTYGRHWRLRYESVGPHFSPAGTHGDGE